MPLAIPTVNLRALLLPGLLALLGGCAATTTVAGNAARVPTPAGVHPRGHPARPTPTLLALPGLESVIGATPGQLERQFGTARLDVREGDARKLQYRGTACVLDVYLYPGAGNADLRATYAEARRASDGKDVDRAACVTALRQHP